MILNEKPIKKCGAIRKFMVCDSFDSIEVLSVSENSIYFFPHGILGKRNWLLARYQQSQHCRLSKEGEKNPIHWRVSKSQSVFFPRDISIFILFEFFISFLFEVCVTS